MAIQYHRGHHGGRPDDPHGVSAPLSREDRKQILSYGLTPQDIGDLAAQGITTHDLMGSYPNPPDRPFTDEENIPTDAFKNPSPLTKRAVNDVLNVLPTHAQAPAPTPKGERLHARVNDGGVKPYRERGGRNLGATPLDLFRTGPEPLQRRLYGDRTTDSRRRLGFDPYD